MCGPLPIYLYPEEQIAYDMSQQSTESLQQQWDSSGPRYCLLCYRLIAHTAKLACDATIANGKGDGMRATVVPPFTNLVDVPDGYRASAMGVTPDDACMVGAPFICSVTRGLSVKYNRLSNSWLVEQSPEIVFMVSDKSPSL